MLILLRCVHAIIYRHLVLFYHAAPEPTTVDNPTGLATMETEITYQHAQKAGFLLCIAKMPQNMDKKMKLP